VLVILISFPALVKSFLLKTPQSLALIGLTFAVVLSVLIGERWPGGSVKAFLDFIPNALAYFLVCLHCNSKRKLQVLVLMMLAVCLFVIAIGSFDLLHEVQERAPVLPGQDLTLETDAINSWNMEHPYLFAVEGREGEVLYRLKGLGDISDPNDFGQLMVCVIPLMFIFWRAKKMLRNIAFVILPECLLLLGIFLTHSRGALLALVGIVIVAARRRIGTLPALLLAGALIVAAMALDFTGGRQISTLAGEDRTMLWGEGLGILKTHPLFGVGLGYMPDFTEESKTAHNSLVVCAAELGMFGLYFWTLFLFPTVRDALATASPGKVSEGEPIVAEEGLFPQATRTIETVDKAEVNLLGRLLVLSFTGFFVTGWFLSRAFVMTLYLLSGMVEVVYEMALQRGMIAPRMRMERLLPYAGGLSIALIVLMYIMLRVVNFTH
jgi:O-antigen ligase